MSEKVLHEVRFVETDEGYRIDIKGDKEQLKKMGMDRMLHKGFGHQGFARQHRFRRGPWGHPMGFWCSPSWVTEDEAAEEQTT